ncbi:hypothetical protein TetV_531 [Tetraselmis virus 1]|uniref:Uncharacterized protein n=1 Tax=Tetraselmis virus 1 TaxID=2060617 RepID=A0A2P0VNY4_9VIRU|nr:hypothetical protein QJ968_gp523 [Tetraselmis virus 1]AUF82613.1 hypothetical protein TetV_531 [Tetraselmis virus 1]
MKKLSAPSSKPMSLESGIVPLVLLAWLLRVAFVSVMLVWLKKMDNTNCDCARSWKRNYLFYSIIADVVVRGAMYSFYSKVPGFVKNLVVVHDLYQMSLLWSYATDLEKEACACSAGWMRDVAQGWPVLRLGMILGAFQFAILFAYMLHTNVN